MVYVTLKRVISILNTNHFTYTLDDFFHKFLGRIDSNKLFSIYNQPIMPTGWCIAILKLKLTVISNCQINTIVKVSKIVRGKEKAERQTM